MLSPSLMMVSYICLKRLSIAINILLAIFGSILLLFGIAASNFTDEADETGNDNTLGVILSSVCGSVSIMASVFGGCFVFKKKKWALFLYVFLLTIDFFIILWIAIPMAILHPQLLDFMNTEFQGLIPLDREGPKFQDNMNKLQTLAECCGLLSYEDWRNSVPQSCHCPPHYEDKASKCVNISREDTRVGLILHCGGKIYCSLV
ncbi:tetraspanin-6-like [Megalops cyprinoides]|uniref:tetraspanin-6-like n=1 Tax=Megalops cyprinoides TaxID=118141 RepID=UPI001864ECB7|nr:tetraspanin-6-like [Megalops cyprinoides]